jgi:hypothetical protein
MSLTQRRIVELVQVGHAQRDCVIIQRSFLAKYESTWRSTRTRAVCLGAIFEATFYPTNFCASARTLSSNAIDLRAALSRCTAVSSQLAAISPLSALIMS